MDTFVNPLPGMTIKKWFSFDFPTGITTRGCHANVDLRSGEQPAQEAVYGRLGMPQRDQGYPCMYEVHPEAEDPWRHDQIIDIDRPAAFDHTARLSGSFVKILTHSPNLISIVKMTAVPLTSSSITPIDLYRTGPIALNPTSNAPNQWYWLNSKSEQELVFTAHAVLREQDWVSKKAEPGIYNLVIKWEFWDTSNQARMERLPISGFDESMTFELSAPTGVF